MKISITIILLLFALFSCKTDNKKQLVKEKTVKENIILSKFPMLLNFDKVDNESFLETDENPTWLSTAYYQFFYLGKLSDTITLEDKIYFESHFGYLNPYKEYYIESDKENPHKSSLDTLIELQPNTSIINNNSFPVLIRNNNKDTVTIGYGSQIPIIMEAIDSLGNWEPIQRSFTYKCGNGVGSIILPPNEIVITFAPIYKGSYKTQLRLTLGNNKSKQFLGYINYKQLKSISNE